MIQLNILLLILVPMIDRFVVVNGGTSCSCSRGYQLSSCYCASGSCYDTCQQCPTGYYNDQNFYCTSNTCSSTTSGRVCKSCAAGKFNPIVQQEFSTSCKTCAFGTWSSIGSGACNLCTAGRGKIGGGSTCEKCVVGKYQDQTTKTECKVCPQGKTTHNTNDDGTGKTSSDDCTGCELGTIVTAPAPNVVCTTCDAGQYRTTYSTVVGDVCTNCLVGKFIKDHQNDPLEHDDSTDCKDCPAGFQYDTPAGCSICEGGTYQDENSIVAVTCKQCPMNTFLADDKGEGVAHDALSDCMDCPTGKFSQKGQRFCERCQAGQIENGSTSSCINCQPGYYSTGNEDECISCSKGKYQKEAGTAYCLPCLRTFYYMFIHSQRTISNMFLISLLFFFCFQL